jgi:hypothetical protein
MTQLALCAVYLDDNSTLLPERVDGRGAGVAGADKDARLASAVQAGLGDEAADVAGGTHDEIWAAGTESSVILRCLSTRRHGSFPSSS